MKNNVNNTNPVVDQKLDEILYAVNCLRKGDKDLTPEEQYAIIEEAVEEIGQELEQTKEDIAMSKTIIKPEDCNKTPIAFSINRPTQSQRFVLEDFSGWDNNFYKTLREYKETLDNQDKASTSDTRILSIEVEYDYCAFFDLRDTIVDLFIENSDIDEMIECEEYGGFDDWFENTLSTILEKDYNLEKVFEADQNGCIELCWKYAQGSKIESTYDLARKTIQILFENYMCGDLEKLYKTNVNMI